MRLLTVLTVLRSGGPDYDPEYVRILRDGVIRNTSIPVRFKCISDVPVPCERIELTEPYSGWWAKLSIFRPGVITGETLYLDLDSIVLRSLDPVMNIPHDFSMLSIKDRGQHCGDSGAMFFRKPFPHVYETFASDPERWMAEYAVSKGDKVFGDQGFISAQFEHIPKLHESLPGFFKSYKYDQLQEERPGKPCAVVCFGGKHRPHNSPGWVKQAWI